MHGRNGIRRLRLPPRVVAAVLTCALVAACGGNSSLPSHPGGSGAPVAHRALDDRPRLVRVERLGDATPAVAFAVAHEAGATASAAVSALVRARVAARGFPQARVRAHSLGFSLETPVAHATEARYFVREVTAAVATPPKAGEAALEEVKKAVAGLVGRRFAGRAEAAVAACSGELGVIDAPAWNPAAAGALEQLREWLELAHGNRSASFAAVGPRDVLDAVEQTLARGPAWPNGDAPDDDWPERDELGVDGAPQAARRLSVAWRVADLDGAVAAAEALGTSGARIADRLAALHPIWRVERALAVTRPRGACVRLDLAPPQGEPGPTSAEVARALTIANEELERALAVPATGRLEEAVARPTDPSEAAAAAAWRALVGREQGGKTRAFTGYTTTPAERGRVDLAAALAAQRDAAQRAAFELVQRNETGQSRFVMLLASACGTSGETTADAGEAALVVSALARARTSNEISIEPWIATDGVGLLVQGGRLGAREAAVEQARRVAGALGELLATARTTPHDVVAARDGLLSALGSEPRPGYALALESVTGGHPSWLEPRGTFAALESAPAGGFDAALHRWLARPLRLAVLTNGGRGQAEAARAELERWVRPVRGSVTRCPESPAPAPPRTELVLTSLQETPEGSYVAFPLTGLPARPPAEARAAVVLLNRSGGLLDQALAPHSASAAARLLGGPKAAALVIQVVAPADKKAAAVDAIRSLFERLSTLPIANADLTYARRELARTDGAQRFDPRRRVIELWRGPAERSSVDPARLLRFYGVLAKTGALVVTVTPRS